MEVNAQKIKKLRTENSWSQQHLADSCGLSLRTIQRVERYGNTSNETLMSISAVFNINKNELVLTEQEVEVVSVITKVDRKIQFKIIIASLITGMFFGGGIVYAIDFLTG